ncbi:MAG: J domain-containing protein [Planctomycetales bacterium]|nr:J domain-containing protein [Planctomycetales bacterium]
MSQTTNWQYLPADPLKFFGLSAGFERRELKRAYGQLIRQFKPETHPAEFQRIRAAYEMLESQNRYGVQQAQATQQISLWDLGSAQNLTVTDKPPVARKDVAVETVSDVDSAILDPKATYQRLSSRQEHSPQDYFILATLADIVDRENKNMYLKWLLTGLKQFPNDPGLLRLVAEFLSAFVDCKLAPTTLVTLSKLIAGEDFFRVTERVWLRCLAELPFEKFESTLQTCEKFLRYRQIRPRLAFYVRLVQQAVWSAPAEWVDQRIAFVESHGSEIDASLEEDVELAIMLRDYVRHDRQAKSQSPVLESIDEMLHAYCTQAWLESAARISSTCELMARNSHAVMDAFAAEPSERAARILTLCSIVLADVSQQTGLDFQPTAPEQLQLLADRTVRDFEETIRSVSSKIDWMRYRFFGLPLACLILGPLLPAYGWQYFAIFTVAWTGLALLIFLAVLKPFVLEKRADQKTRQLVAREYQREWRPRLFRYIQSCHQPSNAALQQLYESGHQIGFSNLVDVILSYASGDLALHFFSRLQPFQR